MRFQVTLACMVKSQLKEKTKQKPTHNKTKKPPNIHSLPQI